MNKEIENIGYYISNTHSTILKAEEIIVDAIEKDKRIEELVMEVHIKEMLGFLKREEDREEFQGCCAACVKVVNSRGEIVD